MVSPYHSSYSTLSASAEPAEPAHIDDTSRLRFRSSKDKFFVSQSRTRLPSSQTPRHKFRGIRTAEDLLAAASGTSRSHQAGRSTSDSMSEIVGPAPSASRDTGDLTQLRTQNDQTAVDHRNAGTSGMISNANSRLNDKRREAMEISRTDQDPTHFSVPLRSGSSSSDNFSRVGSKGSTSTSNRDFSGSSSSSEVGLATKALQEFNEYARHYNLSPLEDEESGNTFHSISSVGKIVLLTPSLKTNQSLPVDPQNVHLGFVNPPRTRRWLYPALSKKQSREPRARPICKKGVWQIRAVCKRGFLTLRARRKGGFWTEGPSRNFARPENTKYLFLKVFLLGMFWSRLSYVTSSSTSWTVVSRRGLDPFFRI